MLKLLPAFDTAFDTAASPTDITTRWTGRGQCEGELNLRQAVRARETCSSHPTSARTSKFGHPGAKEGRGRRITLARHAPHGRRPCRWV